jgi:transposase
VHAYLGVTKFGVTSVVFATGGGYQKPSFKKNSKANSFFSGVCALEYQQNILPSLVRGGNSLFASQGYWADRWIFQQDNAPAHKASGSVAEIIKLMGGNAARVELEWPPMSPDLSWIENVWAWAERELQKQRAGIKTLKELAVAVEQILGSVPIAMLDNYVKGMTARLQEVINRGGAPIGK